MKYEFKFSPGPRTEIALSVEGKTVEDMQQMLDATVRNFKACMCKEEPTDARTKDLVVAGNSCTCIRTDKPCVFPYPLADCRVCKVTKNTGGVHLSHHVCEQCVSKHYCSYRKTYEELTSGLNSRIDMDSCYSFPGAQPSVPYEIHAWCKYFKLKEKTEE